MNRSSWCGRWRKKGPRDVCFFDSPLLPLGWRPMPVLPALIWNPAAGLKEKNTEKGLENEIAKACASSGEN